MHRDIPVLAEIVRVFWRLLLLSFREGKILINHTFAFDLLSAYTVLPFVLKTGVGLYLSSAHRDTFIYTRKHPHTHAHKYPHAVRHTSLLLLVIFLEVLLLRGPETAADRNLESSGGLYFL